MWQPVANSEDLHADRPVSVKYWGTPVVLYRTAAGLAALEDRCPHRSVRLSNGWVDGNDLVCPFHNFKFSPDGGCRAVPPQLTDAESVKRRCQARAYHATEKYGLVWGSSYECNPKAIAVPMPDGDEDLTIQEEVDGAFLPWLDHFLDGLHVVYAHSKSVLAMSSRDAEQRSLDYCYHPDQVRVEATITGVSTRTWFQRLLLAGTLGRFLKTLCASVSQKNERREGKVYLVGEMVGPAAMKFSIDYSLAWGCLGFEAVMFLNPVCKGRLQTSFIARLVGTKRGLVGRLRRAILKRKIRDQHLRAEDTHYLKNVDEVDLTRDTLSEMDQHVIDNRLRFHNYYQHHKHCFHPCSLIHRVGKACALDS